MSDLPPAAVRVQPLPLDARGAGEGEYLTRRLRKSLAEGLEDIVGQGG